jgi:hypothetical protein
LFTTKLGILNAANAAKRLASNVTSKGTLKLSTIMSKILGATFVLFNLQENQTLSNIWKLCIKKFRFKNAIFAIKNLEKRSKGTYQKYPQKTTRAQSRLFASLFSL